MSRSYPSCGQSCRSSSHCRPSKPARMWIRCELPMHCPIESTQLTTLTKHAWYGMSYSRVVMGRSKVQLKVNSTLAEAKAGGRGRKGRGVSKGMLLEHLLYSRIHHLNMYALGVILMDAYLAITQRGAALQPLLPLAGGYLRSRRDQKKRSGKVSTRHTIHFILAAYYVRTVSLRQRVVSQPVETRPVRAARVGQWGG